MFKVNKKNTRKGVKFIQSYHKRHQNDVIDFFLESFLLALNIFQTLLGVYIVDFQQVIFLG